jgi:hypothetical protein
MKIFDTIYNSYETEGGHKGAIDYLRGMAWCEVETTEQPKPLHSDYVESYQGVDLYYDYAADYYFFTDEA